MTLLFVFIVAPFLLIVLIGAPYVRTLKKSRSKLAPLFGLKPNDLILELGVGDGAVALELAKAGYRVIGYEINPFLWLIAWLRCYRQPLISIRLANFWWVKIPADTRGVYGFFVARVMSKLDKRLKSLNKPVTLISYGFELPDKKPIKTVDGFQIYRYK